jgi:hypothetical protein
MNSPSLRPLGACPKQGLKPKSSKRVKQRNMINDISSTKREKTLWKWFSYYIRLRDAPEDLSLIHI